MNTKVLQNLSKQHYVALVLAVAILAWSIALPAFFKVHGHDTVTPAPIDFEVILSDATPGFTATHTIKFNISSLATGTADITKIVFTYDETDTGSLTENFDVSGVTFVEATGTGGAKLTQAIAGTTGQTFTINVDSTLQPGDAFTIVVSGIVNPNHTLGTEAVGSGGVNDKIDAASHVVTADMQDVTDASVASSDTRVTIISAVTMTAAVDTIFTFSVAGLDEGFSINGRATTGTSTPTSFDFGTVVHDIENFLGHELRVQTNASNGFVVTIQETQELTSSTGEMIHRFQNTIAGGTGQATPIAWAAPSASLDEYHTYGHYGLTTSDAELATTTGETGVDDQFTVPANGGFVGDFQLEPRAIFGHTGPTLDSYEHAGYAHVGIALQISSLQPAGDDYTNTLTYVATPTF